MSFSITRTVTAERFNEVLIYLNHITSLEPEPAKEVNLDLKIMKGLFFVHLYGALEKATTDTFQYLLLDIKTLEPRNSDVILPFNVVSMARQWKSIKDRSQKGAFLQMKSFFSDIELNQFHGIDETLFASLCMNIWAKTIDEILAALGISDFILTTSERASIDELVDKRNAVAHGRESARVVGEKFRCDELRKRLNEIQNFINKLIDRLETYLNQREFLKPNAQSQYGRNLAQT